MKTCTVWTVASLVLCLSVGCGTASRKDLDCAQVGSFGLCDGKVLYWCEEGEALYQDCGKSGKVCDLMSVNGGFACVDGPTGCADVPNQGLCQPGGETLLKCASGSLETTDCSAGGGTCESLPGGGAACDIPEVLDQDVVDPGWDVPPSPTGCVPTVVSRAKWSLQGEDSFYDLAVSPDGTLYVIGGDYNNNSLQARDPSNSSLKWEVFYEDLEYLAVGADGSVYVVEDNHHLLKIDPDSGLELWDYYTGSGVYPRRVAANSNLVFVPSYEGLEAISTSTTSSVWIAGVQLGGAGSTGIDFLTPIPGSGAYSTTLFAPDALYMWALNISNGKEVWSLDWPGFEGAAAIGSDNTVYAASDNTAMALHPGTGNQLWEVVFKDIAELGSPVCGPDDTVYFMIEGSKLTALHPESGAHRWTFADPSGEEHWGGAGPVFDSVGRVYVGFGSTIYCLEPGSGTVRWSYTSDQVDRLKMAPDDILVADISNSQDWDQPDHLYGLRTGDDVATDLICNPCELKCGEENQLVECSAAGKTWDLVQACTEDQECNAAKCIDCLSQDHKGCKSGDVWWYDSCGRAEEFVESCGSGYDCSSGSCKKSEPDYCSCTCSCSWCTASVTCEGSGCGSCYSICVDSCYGNPDCGSYYSHSGSCW